MSKNNHNTNEDDSFWWLPLALFIIAVSLGIFVLCSVPNQQEKQEMNMQQHGTNEVGLEYKVITLKDGRQIECVNILGAEVAGISCNWNNPVNQKTTQHN